MADGTGTLVGWRDLTEAIPGGVAIQVDEAFVHVSREMAAIFGVPADELAGTPWRSQFESSACERLDRGIEHARADGRWAGDIEVAEESGEATIGVTLSAMEGDALVWSVAEPDPTEAALDTPRDDREPARFDRPKLGTAVFDVVDHLMFVLDETGEFHYWNKHAVEVLGYTHEEVGGMDPKEVVPEDHHERIPRLMDAIEATEDRRVELDVLAKEGERIPHEFRGTAVEDPKTGETFRCGIARNLTDPRERERELERYATIIETVSDGIYALDESLRFTFVNDGLCEMTGLDPEDIIGVPVSEFFMYEKEVDLADEIRQRVVEGDTSTGTVQASYPTPDGERILESRYRLHPEPDGTFRGSVGVMRDVTRTKRLERELREERRFVENVVDALDDVLYVVNEEGRFAFWNDELCDRFGYTDGEVQDIDPHQLLPEDQQEALPPDPAGIVDVPDHHNVVNLVTKDGDRIPHELRGVTYTDEETGEQYRVGIAQNITDRLERKRKLERQRDDLATLDRINEVLLETTREAIETASRDAVERTACERLVASDLYQFAWVGEPEYDGNRVIPRVTAGDGRAYLDEVTVTVDGRETGLGPVGRAMQTGEVQVADIADPAFGPWREAAAECGFESVAAVPLHRDGSVYGVLVIYATRDDAFSLREQAGFDVLGRAVGSVIYAARNRDLLFADAVIELEFEVAHPESVLLRSADDLDCEITLDGYVSSGEQWILYVTVEGDRPNAVVEAVREDSRLDRARVVIAGDDGGHLELVMDELALLDTVTAAGATLRDARADASGARLVVEVPGDAEIREVVTHVQSEYPEWKLIAHRERDREVTNAGRPGGLMEELTARQREAMVAAFRAGYFAWPRESTAEEVAESLDLAPPTLHGHLRKAEQAILTALLEVD